MVAFLHRRLRIPATRLEKPEGSSSDFQHFLQRFLSEGAPPVFIQMARRRFFNPLFSSSLSASTQGVNGCNLNPPVASLKWRVATPLADPRIGRKAREHLQRGEGYTRDSDLSQAENTLTIALFSTMPVEKVVEKSLTYDRQASNFFVLLRKKILARLMIRVAFSFDTTRAPLAY